MKAPTALNKRGIKVSFDGYKFDSQKEYLFYSKFVKGSGYKFDVHPAYELVATTPIEQAKIGSARYTPDFVIYDDGGKIKHVYDVKNSLTVYGIDASAKLRFRLFAARYGIPVEAVVVRANDFKTIAQCVTKPLNEKQPLIKRDFNYNWLEATNY